MLYIEKVPDSKRSRISCAAHADIKVGKTGYVYVLAGGEHRVDKDSQIGSGMASRSGPSRTRTAISVIQSIVKKATA